MPWLPRDLTLPRQNLQRIIPPHVSFTVLLSPKATGRRSQYTAYCGGVVGLIWGLEKCLLPPSVSSILSCVHSLPEREIVFPTVRRSSQDVMYAPLQRQQCWRETELLPQRLDVRWKPQCCTRVPGVTLSNLTQTLPRLSLFCFSPLPLSIFVSASSSFVSVCLCPFSLALPSGWWSDFEGACRWGNRQLRALLIEPSLCLVTAVCQGEKAWEWIQAALQSPTWSITGNLTKQRHAGCPDQGHYCLWRTALPPRPDQCENMD